MSAHRCQSTEHPYQEQGSGKEKEVKLVGLRHEQLGNRLTSFQMEHLTATAS